MSKADFKKAVAKFPLEQQKAILATLAAAEKMYPKATRTIAWGMPTLAIGDDHLCHVFGFKNHNSLFPASGSIALQMKSDLEKYVVGKGTIQFDMNKPFPTPLLRKILKARWEQINDSYPKKSGVFVEYYKNGGVKAEGKYKGAKMHGAWKFYRLDGSLMRSGSFKDGKQSGIWITYDAKGKKVKETLF